MLMKRCGAFECLCADDGLDPDPAQVIENVTSRLHPTAPQSAPRVVAVITELRAYMDESGTHDGSRVAVVGGCVAFGNEWSSWNSQWQPILQTPGDNKKALAYFHSKEAAHSSKEFYGWPKDEANSFALKLIPLINKHKIFNIAVAVDMDAFNQIIVGETRERLEDPYYFGMLMCVHHIADYIRHQVPRKTRVGYVFEQNTKFERRAHEIFNNIKLKRDGARRFKMGALSFDDRINAPMLQAADIVAYETHREMRRKLGEANVEYASRFDLLTSQPKYMGRFIGRGGLEQIANDPDRFIDPGI
jgi:Protein of unknown function (DUF3800)